MDKLRFILLFAVMLVAGTAAAYDFESGGIYYNIIDKDAKIVEVTCREYNEDNPWNTYASYTGDVIIPSSVTYKDVAYIVKKIGSYAFHFAEITSLTIPEGVDSISNNVCENSRVMNVKLPSTLTFIGYAAFWGCNQLKSISLPEGLNKLEGGVFAYCGDIQKIELPSTLEYIGPTTFRDMSSLTSVISKIEKPFAIEEDVFGSELWNDETQQRIILPPTAILYVPEGSVSAYKEIDGWKNFVGIYEGEPKETTIGGLCYSYTEVGGVAMVIAGDYSNFSSVTIPGSVDIDGVGYQVKAIGGKAFYNQGYLEIVTIESGVELIGGHAFRNCYSLQSVDFPSSMKVIGGEAFTSCPITSVVLPEGVTSIGNDAFSWNAHMLKLVLPSTINFIGDHAFHSCEGLITVVSHIEEPFYIKSGVFAYKEVWDEASQKSIYTPSAATLFVPEGTIEKYKAIEGWTFFSAIYEGEPKEGVAGGLTYSYIPATKTATVIKGDYSSLREVSIPAKVTFDGEEYGVTGIAASAFARTDITSLSIAEGIQTIANQAFRECYALLSVSLPSSIITIGDDAFAYCGGVKDITIPSLVETIGRDAFRGCQMKEILIPASTKSIGEHAFADNRQIVSIRVDANNIVYDSRNNCNALIETASNKLIKACSTTFIPNTIMVIGEQAFSGLSDITNISIPNSVTTIEYWAFGGCSKLSAISIPSSVSEIGYGIFGDCRGLVSIGVDPNNAVYDSRNGCNAIIETSTNTLVAGCNNTVIPRGVKNIAQSAFWGCYRVDSLKLPYGIETIGSQAFTGNEIQYVEIPNSLKILGYDFLGANRNMTMIVSKIKDPSKVDTNVDGFFYNYWDESRGNYVYITDIATLYVPKGKRDLYAQTYPWSKFSTIEEMDGDPAPTPTLSYDGRYVTATCADKDADMYYSVGNDDPSIYYEGPIPVTDLGTVKVMAEKSFASESEVASIAIEYLYNGDTLKLARAGLMADAIKWCGTDSIEKMTVIGPISSDEFSTIRTLKNLKFLNLAGVTNNQITLPDNAFAGTNIVSFVAPPTLSDVGSGIFTGCTQLAAVNWSTDKALPSDALSGVDNPNLLLYLKSGSAPAGINNVVVAGQAETITLVDATGNNNFYCPVAFTAKKVTYTRNFQQKTEIGVSRGWETIALPFDVDKINHEKFGLDTLLVPFNSYSGNSKQRPFWLYTLEKNNISSASSIKANVPYLICMPNSDEYGDQYMLAGNVTFSATDVDFAVSKPIEREQGDIAFTPTYQSVALSADVFALNVNQEYKGYPAGSLFVNNFREVRPFEAYSVHPSQAKAAGARMITVSSLIGGGDDTTGIIDMMLKKNDGKADADAVIKVYSLSGALVKQGRADEVTKSLPKGIYIANGKKFVVK